MKKIALYICIWVICSVQIAKAQHFPTYASINKYFHNKYIAPSNDNYSLTFAKKKGGWYVYELNANASPAKSINEQLFWSAETHKFYVLNYKIKNRKSPEDSNEDWKNEINSESYNYDRIPYYGYSGWDQDVIKDFGNQKNLKDTLLEGLGRAYSSYSMAFLWGQYSYMSEIPDQKEIPSSEPYAEERINNFIKYADLGIEVYHQLEQKFPEYEMMLGKAQISYADEIMYKYSTLCIAGKYKLAKASLKSGLFNPMLLTMARNYLNSMAPNAILFTTGDNDTYPLWYVQETENYRKDVTVINCSLLNLPRYINLLKSGNYSYYKKIKMAWDENIMMNDSLSYAILDSKLDGKQLSINALINELSNTHAIQKTDGKSQLYASGNKFFIKAPELEINTYKVLDDTDKINLIKQLSFNLEITYLLKGDIAILDIIAQNRWERPIYFTIGSDNAIALALKPYLQLEGLVCHLLPKKITIEEHEEENETKLYNTTILYGILMDKIKWVDNYSAKPQKDKLSIREMQTMKSAYMELLRALIAEGNLEKAKNVITRVYNLFPLESYPYGIYDLSVVEAYFKFEEYDKALSILDLAVNNESKLYKNASEEDKAVCKENLSKTLDYAKEICFEKGLILHSRKYFAQLNALQP